MKALLNDPVSLVQQLCQSEHRLMLCGAAGSGKSTLAARLAQVAARAQVRTYCLSADPGSPAFGVPGSLGLGQWSSDGWRLLYLEALCSLDAVRFRLPLIQAAQRLANTLDDGWLLIDTPGVVQGVAGAELLLALAEATAADSLLMLHGDGPPPLAAEIATLPLRAYRTTRSPLAIHPGRLVRNQARTDLWNQYLCDATEQTLDPRDLQLLGTPPPLGELDAWPGRQVALIDPTHHPAMGEVLDWTAGCLRMRIAFQRDAVPGGLGRSLVVRDARRDGDGFLTTSPRPAGPGHARPGQARPGPSRLRSSSHLATPGLGSTQEPGAPRPSPWELRRQSGPRVSLGPLEVSLVNGVYGDPLLQVQLRNRKRCLLFDLGDLSLLHSQAVHQTTEIFLTHAHIDHIFGFLAFLRSRMGNYPPCRIYGPAGTAGHLQALLNGVHWDRIGDQGPRFEVGDVYPDEIRWHGLQAGKATPRARPVEPLTNDCLHREGDFSIRVAHLDHGIPVLAYSLTTASTVHVNASVLQSLNATPGPWIGEFKHRLLKGETAGSLEIPGKGSFTLDELVRVPGLVRREPGTRLAYATDFSGSARNIERLVRLADHADLLVCESSFMCRDEAQAHSTGHLTTRDCVKIACKAGVAQLLPFHFSRRYEQAPQAPVQELGELVATHASSRPALIVPPNLA